MATTLRFVVLDEHKGSGFQELRQSIEKANKSIARNDAALKSQGKSAAAAENGLVQLIGTVTGFGDAQAAASRKTSTFGKVLAGINLATGVLEPAMAGVVVAAGALAGAFASAAAGAAAYSVAVKPLFAETSDALKAQEKAQTAVTAANQQYQAAIASGASKKAAEATRTRQIALAHKQLAAVMKTLPAPVRNFAAQVKRTQDGYKAWANQLSRPVLRPLTLGLRLVHPILQAISPLVRAAAGAFRQLVGEAGQLVLSPKFEQQIRVLVPHVRPTILNLAHAFGNVAAGIFGVVKAFLPMSDTITGGVTKLTAKFREWGQSLPSHSGFQSLMAMFRQQTPQAVQVLKNLAMIIANVARATVGLASPANSKALLNILNPLTQIIAQLSQNQALVRFVLYAILLRKTLLQFAPAFLALKAGYAVIASGTALMKAQAVWAGLLKARAIAVAVATRIWAAAQVLLDAALDANPIGLLVLALAALGAALYAAWTKSATFRKILIAAWKDIQATALAVWHWLTRTFVPFFTKTLPAAFKTVIDWVKHNWPYLLGALTGPIGLAIVWIVKHWRTFTSTIMNLLTGFRHAAANVWDTIWRNTVTRVQHGIADVIGFFQRLPGRALAALRGLGSHLYTFARAALGDFLRGLKSIAGSVLSWIGNFVKNVWNKVKGFFHMSPPHPGSLFYDLGADMMRHLGAGIKAHAHHAQNAFGGAINFTGGGILGGDASANRALARRLFPWPASQWPAFVSLVMSESGFNRFARNPTSGAYGIAQALPPTKYPFAGQAAGGSHAGAQLGWMFNYIRGRYGTPAGAWAWHLSHGWYDKGGWLPPGLSLAMNATGQPERVLSPRESRAATHVTYNINVAVPLGAHGAAVGREIVQKIKQYEKSSGTGWRR